MNFRPLWPALAAAALAVAGCKTLTSSPHYTRGTQALERGDYPAAVKELDEAVRLEPRVSRYHNNLAFAHFQLQNEAKGWYHLRQAVLLDPANRQAAASFESYWAYLVKNGKVGVGMAIDGVLATLGEPDLTLKAGDEVAHVWGNKRLTVRDGKVASIDTWVA